MDPGKSAAPQSPYPLANAARSYEGVIRGCVLIRSASGVVAWPLAAASWRSEQRTALISATVQDRPKQAVNDVAGVRQRRARRYLEPYRGIETLARDAGDVAILLTNRSGSVSCSTTTFWPG